MWIAAVIRVPVIAGYVKYKSSKVMPPVLSPDPSVVTSKKSLKPLPE
jgi:hypothetical protein